MTIFEAISQTRGLCPNSYTDHDMVEWLEQVDTMAKDQVTDRHEGGEAAAPAYSEAMAMQTQLLIGAPYEDVYIFFLMSKIHFFDQDIDRYNNAIVSYQQRFDQWQKAYRQAHLPKSKGGFRF